MGWPLSDTFTEASDTNLISHTLDSGDSWVEQDSGWPGADTDPQVVAAGDYAHQSSDTSIVVDIVDTVAPSADYEVECDVTVINTAASADTGPVVRSTSSSSGARTMYVLALTPGDTNEIDLQRWDAGSKVGALATYSIPGFSATTYNVRLSVEDEAGDVRLKGYVDDVEIISYLDNSANKITAAGYAGIMLRGDDTNVTVDNFAAAVLSGDTTPPNLSLPTSASITGAGVTLGATTDEDNGTSYGIITASGDQSLPTNQEIIDGTAPEELFGLTDKTISAAAAYTHDAIAGLTHNTAYGYAIVHEDTAGNEDAGSRVEGTFSTLEITATSGGTAANVGEATIVSTGGTITITLVNDTFIAAGSGPIGTTTQSNTFVAAFTSAQAEAGGWNATVRDVLDNTDLVRTSNTVATLTVPATAGYDITATETITPVVQAAILTLSPGDITATSFIIAPTTVIGPGGGSTVAKRRRRRMIRSA